MAVHPVLVPGKPLASVGFDDRQHPIIDADRCIEDLPHGVGQRFTNENLVQLGILLRIVVVKGFRSPNAARVRLDLNRFFHDSINRRPINQIFHHKKALTKEFFDLTFGERLFGIVHARN